MTQRRVDLVEEGFDLALRAGVLQDSSLVARRIADSALLLWHSRRLLPARVVAVRDMLLEELPSMYA